MTTPPTPVPLDKPVGYCRICGTPVLEATPQQVASGMLYCPAHQPAAAVPPRLPVDEPPSPYAVPPAAPGTDLGHSPVLAFFLGFLIPGVGAVYNAQYAKGLIHAAVFGFLVSLMTAGGGELGPLLGVLTGTWVFYMAFEAYHTALRRRRGEPVDEFSGLVAPGRLGGSMAGPVALIVLGLLFLMVNLDIIRLYQVARFWPVLLIALGGYLLYLRVRGVAPVRDAEADVRVGGGL